MHHRRIQIPIEARIAHEQAQRTLFAIQHSRHLLYILKGRIDMPHRSGDIQVVQIASEFIGISQHAIGILQNLRHLTIDTGRQEIQLFRRLGKVGCNLVDIVQGISQSSEPSHPAGVHLSKYRQAPSA